MIPKSAEGRESAFMGKIERIQVSAEDRERLCELVKDRNTPQKIVWRSQIAFGR
jgi:hypothetical protein